MSPAQHSGVWRTYSMWFEYMTAGMCMFFTLSLSLRTSEWVSSHQWLADFQRRFGQSRRRNGRAWCDGWINLCHIVCTNVQLDTGDGQPSWHIVCNSAMHGKPCWYILYKCNMLRIAMAWSYSHKYYIPCHMSVSSVDSKIQHDLKLRLRISDHTPGKQPIVVVGCFGGGEFVAKRESRLVYLLVYGFCCVHDASSG